MRFLCGASHAIECIVGKVLAQEKSAQHPSNFQNIKFEEEFCLVLPQLSPCYHRIEKFIYK